MYIYIYIWWTILQRAWVDYSCSSEDDQEEEILKKYKQSLLAQSSQPGTSQHRAPRSPLQREVPALRPSSVPKASPSVPRRVVAPQLVPDQEAEADNQSQNPEGNCMKIKIPEPSDFFHT